MAKGTTQICVGFVGKGARGAPGRRERRLGPLALDARSLAAVLLAVLEDAARAAARAAAASGEARMGDLRGPEAAELRGKADAVQRRPQAMSGPWLDP